MTDWTGDRVFSILDEPWPLRPLHRCQALDEARDQAWEAHHERHRDEMLALADRLAPEGPVLTAFRRRVEREMALAADRRKLLLSRSWRATLLYV